MAKANFETNNTMTNKLGLLLMKSAAMHLSNG